ncbi:TPA: transcription-repair coupling factor [Neisseria meningitidis]|uniref:Transcription-repair-coupling factor n=1 Tax=Neisseria meningitidis serogroup B TaxID=491 RepID=A0A0H5QD65_NEIMI|nr:transcription-repair coupling factor [Neisseria meningitidis]ADZ01396.1 transcription-repair coupling factor [Neisseria meningitidis M04-240196]EGC66875.1 transcription-repair coupling factor [Neisseria meningitidis M01-240013]MCI3219145.1 transcription-repair coupling factor [Neisseria meningitidis]MCL4999811.1 transcription-repair coupling factor [Neisseria meningitidis]MCV6651868.1 transcription-repair coupling factor [Neisseria meningitidis]
MTYPIPKPREKSRWPNLSQGSLPLALARYLPHKQLKVVLTLDAEQALRLQTAWRFFRPHDTAVFLPDWETLPYERFSPHQDLVSERLSALWQIKSGAADVLFVPVATAMQKLPPVPFLAGRTFWLKTGQTLDIGRLKSDLVDAGYNHVSHVVAAGEFAVRGGIVDLFPMGSEMPYRIDLFDDEIDSIKTFDTETQRTISPVSEIRLLPAHEFPTDSEAQKIFRSRFREEVDGNPNDAAVYKAVSNGHFGAGVEYYLPLFFENELETLFDYIGEDALFVSLGDVHAEANRFWSDVKSRYAMAQGDETYPPLLPQYLYLSADVFAGRLKNYGQVLPDVSGKEHTLPDLAVNRQSDEPLQALKDFQTTFDGRILLCAESLGRRETMLGFLQQNGLKAKPVSDWQGFLSAHEPLMITVAPLAYGFKLGGLQSPNQQQTTSASEGEGDAVTDQTEFSAAATNPLPSPLPQEREQSAAAVSDDLKAKSSLHLVASNLHGQIRQQPTPSPVGEGWGEGKAVAAQTEFPASATNPLPSPLPQEREQSAAAVSDNLKTESSLPPGKSNLHGQIQQQPAPSPVGEGWGESKAVADQSAIAVITESELYQYVARSRAHNRRKKHAAVSDGLLRDLAEINIGDPVVHEEHGIGRYMGLVTMDLGDETNEMMLLEYAGEAQLYVPVSQLHLISRYSGQAHENVALHKLGSGAWNKAKRKAAEKARDTAAELLNLYAQRAAQSGHKFEINELDYQAFADGFGYEETEDQAAAIAAVIKDLTQTKPMDRLVCGDVGFGKTEVALRAAFVAVMGGKQVAVLAPTTLLVEQHAQNFADRFADFPVKVASLSRFNNSKATKAALEGMADGTVDIVIGTHKLVQDDIKFKNLGLVIIDEEHRFGVRQKEQLKRLRANVDILTMTATPIPRTLSMALEGLRDFSLITTAPSRRLAVKTFVKPFSEGSVREAVLRELKRGGQVFFLHNEVDTIENMRERLETLLPEARIGVAHGQLRERELEQVMRDFLQQRFNVLLCSTIIETGIDIPNANTIIINRADKFGLAQLHQLRGRVGRSHHQAYAYLLTPEYITKDAEKRLDAIAAADELGAGFTLAMQDLEIRGAGEILGEGQSGEMIQVGFTLYTEMLKQAVRDLKKGRQPDLDAPLGITTEIKLHSPALLPEDYCPDIHERLVLYKRLAVCETVQQINTIHEELVDRFGLPEQPVKTLIESHHLRLMAKELGIDAIDAAGEAVTVTFGKNNNVDPTEIILLIQNDKKYRLAGADKLRFTAEMENIEVRINTVKNVLKTLQNRCLPK